MIITSIRVLISLLLVNSIINACFRFVDQIIILSDRVTLQEEIFSLLPRLSGIPAKSEKVWIFYHISSLSLNEHTSADSISHQIFFSWINQHVSNKYFISWAI